jgi:nucleoside-diphosphate-sugar epimerase
VQKNCTGQTKKTLLLWNQEEESMRALVTGSSGFVGSHLVEELVRQKYTARVLLRGGGLSPWLEHLPIERAYASFDDIQALTKALADVDYVFHVGGVTKAVKTEGYIEGNVLPAKALLEAACAGGKKTAARLKRFVLVSSHAMMGPVKSAKEASGEDDVPQPVEAYGRAKMTAELVARSYADRVPVTIIRPPTVYGPRDKDCLEMFAMIKKHINLYYGNAKKYTSIVHVRDLVEGMIAAAVSPKAVNRAYFLCNDEALTWQELQEAVKQTMGKRAPGIHLPACTASIAAFFSEPIMKLTKKPLLVNKEKVKLSRPRYWIASNKRARSELKFAPKINLADGLAETYAWYVENGWL